MSYRLSPMGLAMLADEAALGHRPIWPGEAPSWLIAEDWEPWPVLSIAGGELRIIAIRAVRVGCLTRLIEGARADGLAPVIVCPVGRQMPAILARWGWQQTPREEADGFLDEWRPPAGWRE